MKNLRYAALAAVVSCSLTGCATVMHGANQTLALGSEPNGATVKLTNGATCVTPCKLDLPRRHDLRADYTLDGYRPAYVLVQSKMSGATFGNILAGGIIGGLVDGANGASNKLSPNPINVRLTPLGQTTAEVLLDAKGKTTVTVDSNNEKVRTDVAKTIGTEAAGMPMPAPAPASGGT